jgi:phospholipase/carboxylesterase
MFHGYGANGKNLLELACELQKAVPQALFISVNAVEPWEGGFPDCYQWFSLYSQNLQKKELPEIATNIISANQKLAIFIKQQLNELQLGYQNLALLGFSQGAMMANYQAMTLPQKIAGVLSYSGKVILPTLLQQNIMHKPKVCLIHGTDDSVLPFDNFLEAKQIFDKLFIPHEDFALTNLDHSIDYRGLEIGKQFLQKIF